MTLDLNIVGLSGYLGTVSVDAHGSLACVKAAIEGGLGVPARGHRLLHEVTELRDGWTPASAQGQIDLTLVRRPADQARWLREIEALNWAQVPSWMKGAPQGALADEEVVLAAAAKAGGNVLMYAASELRNDRRFILDLVTQSPSGRILEHVPLAFRRDHEIVLSAAELCPAAFRYAAEELRQDHKFVLAAVTQNGLILEFVPEALRRDSQVAHAAVASHGAALRFVPRDLQGGLLAAAKATLDCAKGPRHIAGMAGA